MIVYDLYFYRSFVSYLRLELALNQARGRGKFVEVLHFTLVYRYAYPVFHWLWASSSYFIVFGLSMLAVIWLRLLLGADISLLNSTYWKHGRA